MNGIPVSFPFKCLRNFDRHGQSALNENSLTNGFSFKERILIDEQQWIASTSKRAVKIQEQNFPSAKIGVLVEHRSIKQRSSERY